MKIKEKSLHFFKNISTQKNNKTFNGYIKINIQYRFIKQVKNII